MHDQVIAGRYRLVRLLGAGGSAEVWLARDDELGREVAIKLLAPTADPVRFEREARAAAALSPPNVSALYDFGATEARPYMVLEHLPGGSLEEQLRATGALADDETARVAQEVASGLAHAHERGVVHRDLKPANILFDAEGRAKIADFGIARLGSAGTVTEAGTLLGTAAYISPEQAAGRPATPASDVYSFGVMLYRMLTGRLPFESESALDLVVKHRDEDPPPLTEIRPDAPPTLAALASAALAKDPSGRPADGAALAAALTGASPPVGGETEQTQVLPLPQARQRRTPGGRGRWRLVPALLAFAALAAAGIGLAMATTTGGDSDTEPRRQRATDDLAGDGTGRRGRTRTAAPLPAETAVPSTATTTRPATTRATTEPPKTTRSEEPAPAPPPATTAPPTDAPTTEPPPTTTEPPPTDEPPTTTEPPPTTTEPPPTTPGP